MYYSILTQSFMYNLITVVTNCTYLTDEEYIYLALYIDRVLRVILPYFISKKLNDNLI